MVRIRATSHHHLPAGGKRLQPQIENPALYFAFPLYGHDCRERRNDLIGFGEQDAGWLGIIGGVVSSAMPIAQCPARPGRFRFSGVHRNDLQRVIPADLAALLRSAGACAARGKGHPSG